MKDKLHNQRKMSHSTIVLPDVQIFELYIGWCSSGIGSGSSRRGGGGKAVVVLMLLMQFNAVQILV